MELYKSHDRSTMLRSTTPVVCYWHILPYPIIKFRCMDARTTLAEQHLKFKYD
uniref:Uncharacterized protein n=1 Tax=Solanum lycopersicum TaxID=4081 RepID=A0A3Q7F2F0_SOLLC